MEVEHPIVLPTGEVRWLKVNKQFFFDPSVKPEKPLYSVLAAQDITSRKEAEEKIKKARELFEITLQNVPSAIYHFDSTGKILYLNQIAAYQMGYDSVDEVLAEKDIYAFRKKLKENFELLNENGNPSDPEKSCSSIALKTSQPAQEVVQFVNKKNGDFFWLLTKSVPLTNEKGELTNVFTCCTDITMQKVSEFALRQSEEKYRTLFETMDQGFCVIDLIFDANNKVVDYRFLECNPMFTQQSGLVDAVGKRILEFAPNLEQHWFTLYKNIALTGEPTRYIQKAEELGRWFEVYAFRVGDENSTKVAILFTDITERKKAEQALELSEQRFRTAFENAAIGMVFTDKEGHFLYANKAYENIVGYSLVELQQRTFMDITHPDDIQTDINDNARILQGQIRGRVAEKRYIRKDGKIVWVQLSVSLTKDNQGNAQHIIGLVEDITDKKLAVEKLKQSEETFRTLSNTLPQLVWMTTANGHEEFASKQWEEYTGVATTDENRFWNLLLHPDDRNIVQAAWGKSLSDGSSYKVTCRLKHYTGEYRWNSCEGVAIKDSEGNILKWVGAYSDIHEEKLKEQKKDEFISIASHEMKTPLTSAKAYLQLLEMTLDENDTPSVYVKKASAAVERLHSLITELLDASKIQNGQLNYTITKFDFNEMIDNTIENIQHSTAHALIKTGTIESVFSGDRDRLQQVVINLLTNAIKYSPNAKEVTIQVEQQDNMLKVSVTDKGIGMNKKHLEKIFERYYRVEEHAVHFQGLGIGLYISYNIIQRHQGKMWVESEPDKGSTFYFTLPFVNDFK